MGLLRSAGASAWLFGQGLLVGGTMMMALSVYWDAWWHEAVGRESFWIPPHLGIYAGLITSLGGFLVLRELHRNKIPRGLWIYVAGVGAVVASGYGDELWHQKFGVERIGTLEAIWSPTHVAALVGGMIAALGIISYLLQAIKTGSPRDARLGWLVAAEFGVLVSITTLLLLPLGPETPFRLLGVWGAPVVAFAILALRFFGSAFSKRRWALLVITTFNWAGNALLLSNHSSLLLLGQLLAVGLVPPFLADIIIQRGRMLKAMRNAYVMAGLVWGVIFGTFFYPLTNGLSFGQGSLPLDYTSLAVIGVTSAIASALAGFLAGWKAEQWMRSRTLVMARAEVPGGAPL